MGRVWIYDWLSKLGERAIRESGVRARCGSEASLMWVRIVVCVTSVFLVSCSGGGGESSVSTAAQSNGIAGVDTNGNGVRDDVEKYINETYSDPAQADTKSALMQYAKVLQATLLDAATTTATPASVKAAETHLQDIVMAFECLGARRPDDFVTVDVELLNVVLDTEERQQAYLKAAELAEGAVTQFLDPEKWTAACS